MKMVNKKEYTQEEKDIIAESKTSAEDLNYCESNNNEQLLKLYRFLEFHTKELEKNLDEFFREIKKKDKKLKNKNGK